MSTSTATKEKSWKDFVQPGPSLAKNPEALSIDTLQEWLDEIRNQPNWRIVADREADYYDGNQLTQEQLELMEERNLPPLITNLIKPTVDVVLGMEARTRSDWKVRPEAGDASDDVAEALSEKLHQAQVTSQADRSISEAYAQQIKVGVGWVEVARNSDPFKPPYRVRSLHRREMFWDWRAREPDLSDARYLVRKQWLDIDTVGVAFPDKIDILRQSAMGWQGWDIWYANNPIMAKAFDEEQRWSLEQFEWINPARRRIVLYEVWYRQITKGLIIRTSNGNTELFDEGNAVHAAEVAAGNLPVATLYNAVRVAIYAGPHLLQDRKSPYKHQFFPYIPFFGFREDLTNMPYGLVRTMVSPQDEVNARKSKMQWLLSASRVILDADAVTDINNLAQEVARPDALIQLNPQRKPNSRFEILEPGQMGTQQFQLLQEAKQEINQSAGVYQSMLGENSNAQSGLAINSLVEQGTVTLGEINDNYRHSRRLVGELLCELVKEDLENRINIPVEIDEGRTQKTVLLNQPTMDQKTGQFVLANNVSAVRCAVVLDDVPQTPTFRNQQLSQLSEMVKSLPPQLQANVMDFVIEATDLPGRHELAERIRKALGIQDDAEQDPQKAAMQQQIAQLQQQLQAAQNDPRLKIMAAQSDKLEADKVLQIMKALQIVDAMSRAGESGPVAQKADETVGITASQPVGNSNQNIRGMA